LQRQHNRLRNQKFQGFLFHRRFPVDVRHNAKIRREELKRWAEARGRVPARR
jgi:hypothetical protein